MIAFGNIHIGAFRCLAFNLADAAVMCGIAALLVCEAQWAPFCTLEVHNLLVSLVCL